MKTSFSTCILAGLFWTWVLAAASPGICSSEPTAPGEPARPITVQLSSGRWFTAEIDPKSSESELVLRWRHGATVVLRPIQWDRVVQAEIAGETISGEALRKVVSAVRQAHPNQVPAAAAVHRIDIRGSSGTSGADQAAAKAVCGVEACAGQRAGIRQAPKPAAVRSLAIEAGVANWDASVEADGLVVRVYALDADGATVPVDGTLEVELIGERTGMVNVAQPFRSLGRWVQRVRQGDFGADGAVYRLPFQEVHPEFEKQAAPYGAVHARLSVPGQGVFEATAGAVRIRPYSPIRDRLEQATGHRFFPAEQTGDGRR